MRDKFSWYPQVGVSFNPFFTEAEFDEFARSRAEHARSLRVMAFAAFGSAGEWSSSHPLTHGNFEFLVQATRTLILLHSIAREDDRSDAGAIAVEINLLFWRIIGAAEHYLCFEEGDDWLKDWDSSLSRGGCLVRLLVDLALAARPSGSELQEMITALTRLATSAQEICKWHMELGAEFLSVHDSRRANLAGAMWKMLVDALEQLGSGAVIQASTRPA